MIYLDVNATTPLDSSVLQVIHSALEHAWGNPSSSHDAGKKAKSVINEARANVADMVGGTTAEIIFTSGGTEGNNMILQSACRDFLTWKKDHLHLTGKQPHFITSNLEHDSVKLVLEEFVKNRQADVTFVAASRSTGRVEVSDIMAAIQPNTCMISIMLANNETGVIQPISEICQKVRVLKRQVAETQRILLHTDAAQAIGKIPLDVEDLGVDYLTIVGHKFYGPRIGAIYVRGLDRGHTPLYPLLYGGGQERNYRPGTENTGMIAGLGKAAELVVQNIEQYQTHMRTVRDYLELRLQEEFGERVHINGKFLSSERIPNTCNVSFLGTGLEGHKVLSAVQCFQASVGAACHSQNRASPILLAVGVPEAVAWNALRLSVGRDTSKADIDNVVADLKLAINSLSLQNCKS